VTPLAYVITLIAGLSFVGGCCLTYWWQTRPQADALAALRRIHEASEAWTCGTEELIAHYQEVLDTIDAEVADLDLYADDYSEPAT